MHHEMHYERPMKQKLNRGKVPHSLQEYLAFQQQWKSEIAKDYETASPEDKPKIKAKWDALEIEWKKYRQNWHEVQEKGNVRE